MDPASILFNIFLVLLLVILNGFFVAAEFAMVKVRSSRIETLVSEGNLKAKFAQRLTKNLDAYLSACQFGITLASLGLGWVGEPAVAKMLTPILSVFGFSEQTIETISFTIAFSVITSLHIILGELAPKSLAIQKAEQITMWTAPPLIGFYKIMYPFIWFMNGTANKFLKSLGLEHATDSESAHTEQEIRILMEESHKQGFINQTELTLMDNIFDFAEKHAHEIMIPRTDMICLDIKKTNEENLDIALREEKTRYPVCDSNKDDIIGFVHIKDLLTPIALGEAPALQDITREILAVPENMQISAVLKLMQKNKSQIAIAVDEYGGTAGLVTVKDILEEIVGEMQDEFDDERPLIEMQDSNAHIVDGKILIEEFNDFFDLKLQSDDVDTLGGWICARTELPLEVNRKITYEGYEFIITEADNMRVNRVLVRKKE
ncbi:hemolysin family protein [Pelosinus sp. UFO1]|uniref:hemolysin family protein n=1 Tax=Pelosinus sp. UFO1 TaxID=484770 RepID=UPI0004D0D8DE|nr:hemolysin family protein [Pelosinus sp. UFO1]AIF51181.1 putative signal transduction protein with CBS domain containing protein [Pelosinus sp. UFO1]